MISSLLQPLALLVVLGCVLAYVVGIALHRLFFSPLSKYPGPKVAAVTRIPFLWHYYHGNSIHWIRSLHEKYGDVVRTAPQELSYCNGDGFKDIYGHASAGKHPPQKDLRMYNSTSLGVVPDIVRANNSNHARFRRNFSHAFSNQALKEQEPLILKYVDLLVEKLSASVDNNPQDDIDMVKMFNLTTFDIMADLTFGESLGLLQDSKYNSWVTLVYSSFKMNSLLQIFRYIPRLKIFSAFAVTKSMAKSRQNHYQNCMNLVDRRLASKTPRSDIWGLVLKASDEKRLNLDEMYANSNTFMIAGTETTATLLSGLTYQLLINPEKLEKLTQEIRSSFSSSEELKMSALENFEDLTACLTEGLRMYPPVPVGLPRVLGPEGKVVLGEMIPGNTTVSVSHWATYRSPKNFRDPNAFRPERWTGDPLYESDKKACLQPFSMGPRNCIGKNLAYHEMRLIIAKVLWHFDLSLSQRSANWGVDQKVFFVWEKPPLLVKLSRRK